LSVNAAKPAFRLSSCGMVACKTAAALSGYEKPPRSFVHSKNRLWRKVFFLMIRTSQRCVAACSLRHCRHAQI
jgi:hypothetical protein